MRFRFLNYLWKESGPFGVRIAVSSTITGILQGCLILVVSLAAGNLSKGGLNFRYLALFILSIAAFVILKRYSMNTISDQVQSLIFNMRVRIADKIRNASLVSFEKFGKSGIYTALTEHSEVLVQASRFASDVCSSAFMTLFCFAYIAVISMAAFYLSVAVTAVSIMYYLGLRGTTERDMMEALKQESSFLDYIGHVIEGFNEIKINSDKSNDLFDNYINRKATETRDLKVKSERCLVGIHLFGETFLYVLLGTVIFLLPRVQSIDAASVGKILAIILFMIGPLSNVVMSLPFLSKADAALASIEALENGLDAMNDMRDSSPMSKIRSSSPVGEIVFNEVTFNHTDSNGKTVFTLGPLDLTIHAGETVFLGGGNGSGKSTLLKLLTGLYYPTSGSITCDSVPVDMGNYVHYRDLFSIIFADFHLFDRLYGLRDMEEERVYELLEAMKLSDKTLYVDGRFTNLNLSTGQRKRLAMIASRLEEKQLFVFDEVAADQDPMFRKYFYDVYLKELKAQGKTIIAATHDDRYFHVADRVLKMEEGRLVNGAVEVPK